MAKAEKSEKAVTHSLGTDFGNKDLQFATGHLLEKAAEATEIAVTVGRLSLLQRRINNVFLQHAKPRLMKCEIHSIRFRDLLNALEYTSNDHRVVVQALSGLRKIFVVWNYLNKGKVSADWGESGILSEIRLRDGMVEYAYPPTIRSMLFAPTMYSVIDLRIQNEFCSNYSLALYEILKKYESKGFTDQIDVEDWKELLGVDKDNVTYKEFKNLNRKIFKPAIEEINAVSDILAGPEYFRNGKAINAIRFRVEPNTHYSLGLPIPLADHIDLKQRLVDLGCTADQIRSIVATYDSAYILGNLEAVEERYAKGKILRPVPYLLKALEKDFRLKEMPIEKHRKESNEAQTPGGLLEAKFRELEQAFARELARLIREKVSLLSEDQRVLLEEDFFQYAKAQHPIVYGQYRKNGLRSKVVQGAFYAFAGDELRLTADQHRLREFIAAQGYCVEDFEAFLAKNTLGQ